MREYKGPKSYSYPGVTRGFIYLLFAVFLVGILVCGWFAAMGNGIDRIISLVYLGGCIAGLLWNISAYRRMNLVYTPSDHALNWHTKDSRGQLSWADVGAIKSTPLEITIDLYDKSGVKRVSLDKNIGSIVWLLSRILDRVSPTIFGSPPKTRFFGPVLAPILILATIGLLIFGAYIGVVGDLGGWVPPVFFLLIFLSIWAGYFKIIRVESDSLRIWSLSGSETIAFSSIRHVQLVNVAARITVIGLMIEYADDKEAVIRLPFKDIMRLYVQIPKHTSI